MERMGNLSKSDMCNEQLVASLTLPIEMTFSNIPLAKHTSL